MKKVAEILHGIKFVEPDKNGWSFDYDFLKEIAHAEGDENVSMEQVEEILNRIIRLYS